MRLQHKAVRASDFPTPPALGVMQVRTSPTRVQLRKQKRSKALESSEISDEIQERSVLKLASFRTARLCRTEDGYNQKLTKRFCRNLLSVKSRNFAGPSHSTSQFRKLNRLLCTLCLD